MKSTTQSRALGICGALALLLAGAAGAGTYNVDRFDNSTANACDPLHANDCALRGAILRANSNPGDDVDRLQAGTYPLSIPGADENGGQTGDLDVTDTLLVVGRGPEVTVVDAGGDGGVNDRVFDVNAPGERLTLRGLTVTGGSPDAGGGGGIRAIAGSLTLEACAVSGNEFLGGGATAIRSLANEPGDLTQISDSWITGNTGEYAVVSLRAARIERSTVSGNARTTPGSMVYFGGPSVSLLDSAFGDNTLAGWSHVVDLGGASVAEIAGCTLVNPDAGALVVGADASATLSNTLLAGACTLYGQLASLGGNLESPGDTCLLGGSDLVNVSSPGLSALGFFGGLAPV